MTWQRLEPPTREQWSVTFWVLIGLIAAFGIAGLYLYFLGPPAQIVLARRFGGAALGFLLLGGLLFGIKRFLERLFE